MRISFNRVPTVRKRDVRQTVWKGLNIIVAVVTLANVSAAGLFFAPKIAGAVAIWTTTGSCGSPQDANHYKVGDIIYVNGSGFSADSYDWSITGKPGGASGDPGSVVASQAGGGDMTGQEVVGGSGNFCFDAYTVKSDDWGEYQVKFGGVKGDNYRVDGNSTGSLMLTKVVDWVGGASPDDFSFTISPDTQSVGTIHTSGGTYTFEGLTPEQSYTITESSMADYHQVSSTCTAVPITAGSTATCVIHNAINEGSVVVHKGLDANGDGTFEGNDDSGNTAGFRWGLDNDPSTMMFGHTGTTNVGSHTVSENSLPDYTMVGWISGQHDPSLCDDPENFSQGDPSLTVTSNNNSENPAEILLCNQHSPLHTTLTVHKMLDSGDGYTNIDSTANAMGFHWGLAHADGLDLISQWGTAMDFGAHGIGDGVTEATPAGYAFQGWFYGTSNSDHNCLSNEGIFHYPGSSVSVGAGQSGEITLCNVKLPSQPSLTITKTDNHVTAQPGETLTYQVTVTNSGDLSADNVQVDDTLPSFLGTPSNISNSGAFSAGHVVWNNLFVAGHGSITLTYDATINPVMPVGTTVLHNIAILGCSPFVQIESVSAASVECPYSGTATDDTSVTVVGPTLSITKTNNSGSFVNPGATVTYTIVVSNAAGATQSAANVVLNDTLPAGFTYTVGGGSAKSFNLGNIAPGGSVTTTYTVLVSASEAAGTYTNTAAAKGDNTTSVSATSNVTVRVPQVLGITTPTLSIAKSVDTKTSNPGKTVTYTVTVTNSGDGNATNTAVSDTLPAGFTFADDGTSTHTWQLGTLLAGGDQTFTYKVKIGSNVKAGTYDNHAVATADGVDPVSAKASVKVVVPAVLGLATTGVSARDYAIFALGSLLLAFGFIGLQSMRRRELQA